MLTREFIKTLATKAQQLNPIVSIGAKGLTTPVHNEVDAALTAHELVKIRIQGASHEIKNQMIKELTAKHQAVLIHKIGHVAVFYRAKEDKVLR